MGQAILPAAAFQAVLFGPCASLHPTGAGQCRSTRLAGANISQFDFLGPPIEMNNPSADAERPFRRAMRRAQR